MADPVHEHRGRSFSTRLILVRVILVSGLLAFVPRFAVSAEPVPVPVGGAVIEKLDTSRFVADTAVAMADTTSRPPREFLAPNSVHDSVDVALARLWESPEWPLPAPADLATGDLADWLTFQPTIDVDDASAPGQLRRYTRWGLIDRVGDWIIDGRSFGWQRLSFPQVGQFDPTVLPSFTFNITRVSRHVSLNRESEWPLQTHSSYFLRQGDFSETYSQGGLRRRFPLGVGIDFGFLFYENTGRYTSDDRKTRNLRLQLVGPLRGRTFWSVEFSQFQDRSQILTSDRFSSVGPYRDDLLYSLDASIYRPADSAMLRSAGLRIQSGKQDIKTLSSYRLESHDRTWTLWGRGSARGWDLNANAALEQLRVETVDRSRWGLSLDGRRIWTVGDWGTGSVNVAISDWDTDPMAVSLGAALAVDRDGRDLIPTLRLERSRLIPTLFDRDRPRSSFTISQPAAGGPNQYSEEGDAGLDGEWRNTVSLGVASARDTSGSRLEFNSEAQATYVQRYIRWADVSESSSEAFYRPVSGDARSVGLAMGLHSRLFRKFHLWVSYAAKYAETLNHTRLPGYYPHKASAIVSWIAPQFRFGIDLHLNAAAIWWSGDPRIVPTGYRSTHVLRFDLSGSATMKSFTFYFSLQNVANFPYRTSAGVDFTGRTVRFGFNWNFLD